MSGLLQDYVAVQAGRRPDATAVVMNDERLTYAELEEESNRLARLLLDAGIAQGDRVCIFQQKSPDAIVSMLATLKANAAYVPIDVGCPAERVAKIIDSADPRLLLASSSAAELLADSMELIGSEVSVGFVDAGPDDTALRGAFARADRVTYSPAAVSYQNTTGDPAHLLFTSGSTGTPKGVVITHANVVAFVEWAVRYFGMKPGDRISGHPPLHFDLSTFDIYGTFRAGAELHLVPPALNLMPHKLADFIRCSELTQWFAVPSIFTYLAKFDVIEEGDFPALERVLWCGEVLPTPILSYWMRRLPHASFTNLYGPTEATIASSYYTVEQPPATETDPIPIGTPCEGEELLILDADLQPVAPGEIGDLYIGGVGLSPGYWRDVEKTEDAFVADPRSGGSSGRIYRTGDLARVDEDGLVYFLGRADSQIKHRGYRIELGEIETAANALDVLGECAVVAIETGGFEGTAICCAYTAEPGRTVEPAELSAHLRRTLPGYMVPSRWTAFDVLPKNVNGKIDRRALREQFAAEEERELRETHAQVAGGD